MRKSLNVGKWPDRKKPTLYIQEGSIATILAYFVSDKAAEAFLDCAKQGICFDACDKIEEVPLET